ncbi:hypothetical protein D9756_008954 [Leucocoprinus leucothites]|uniref:Major facilitator superfamily (MFS) profile domain-containing protein n=1 Tax=Leucocoprinus leucothites TaxID=201217 RepID=A0A8H5CXA7_9AGAR|nr:hypothetical protein D9756_008954 [Leucoagaricus leucothites]
MYPPDDQRAATMTDSEEDEPLLPLEVGERGSDKVQRTPLPRFQLSILLYLVFCQGAALNSIYPFENELLLRFAAGDEGKVAYYASIMDACRYFAGLFPVLFLSRASDYLGRKPILILSLTTMAVSTFLLGVSTKFWEIVASFLSNIEATVKTSIGEITDETNRADAFAPILIPLTFGGSTGSLISGYLANPVERFPRLFHGRLWHKFPYLLPCGASSLICFIGLLVVCFWFRETLQYRDGRTSRNSGINFTKLMPMRTLLTPRVLLTGAMDIAFSFFQSSFSSLQPLFLGIPISDGGFGFQPLEIGSLLFVYGLVSSFVTAFSMGPLVRKFGLRAVLTAACISYIPMFLLVPLINSFAKDWVLTSSGSSHILMWAFLFLLYVSFCINGFGYSCLSLYITSSAPNKQSLGSINGMMQVPTSLSRLVGSSFATFMLGLSIRKEWMGGYAVYYVLGFMACGCVVLVTRLPRDGWSNM